MKVVTNILRLSAMYVLCGVSTYYVQADLFDLYELGYWRTGVPEHVQQAICKYYSNCICICVVPEQVDCLEFTDHATVKVLARKGTRAYALYLGERSYKMSLLEAPEFQEHIPAIVHFTPIFDGWTKQKDAKKSPQVVIALTSSMVKTIMLENKTKGALLKGCTLKQHMIHKTQWYLYKYIEYKGGDGWYATDAPILEIEPVSLEGIPEVCFVATILDNNVYIFKRREDYFEYFICLPHNIPVAAAAFSLDTTRIVTACKDNTLRIWSLLTASADKLVTLEQLLLVKLLYTASYYEGSWDFDNLAQRLQVPLAENLEDQTQAGVAAYLFSVFKTLRPESQDELTLWRRLAVKKIKKQSKCVVC